MHRRFSTCSGPSTSIRIWGRFGRDRCRSHCPKMTASYCSSIHPPSSTKQIDVGPQPGVIHDNRLRHRLTPQRQLRGLATATGAQTRWSFLAKPSHGRPTYQSRARLSPRPKLPCHCVARLGQLWKNNLVERTVCDARCRLAPWCVCWEGSEPLPKTDHPVAHFS
jgi:hypothetical protein